jgi:hypothetical protein
MNVAGAGPLVCLWFEWREGHGDRRAGKAGCFLSGASLVLFGVGMILGLVLGWLHWTPAFVRALTQVGSRVHFGVWELVFSAALMGAHWAWWRAAAETGPGRRAVRSLLPLLASTNLLYHFPLLFAVIAQLEAAPDLNAPLSSAEFRAKMADGLVLAQVVHFWLASLAAVGVVLVGYALFLARRQESHAEYDPPAICGSRLALASTLLQIPVGLWLLSQAPSASQSALFGGDLVTTGLFGASILAAVWLLHQLAAVALGETRESSLLRTLLALVLVVALMSSVLVLLKPATSETRSPDPLPQSRASSRVPGPLCFPA